MNLTGVIKAKGMQPGTGPKTRKEQIIAWYAEDTPEDRNYRLMWGSVFLLINGAYGLERTQLATRIRLRRCCGYIKTRSNKRSRIRLKARLSTACSGRDTPKCTITYSRCSHL